MAYATDGNARLLEHVPGGTTSALDIGCGTGRMAEALGARGIMTHGVTHDEEERVLALEHCERVWVHDLETGLPSKTSDQYDLIILSHVLEHIVRPERLMTDIRERANSDTLILCAIPNMLFLYNRIKVVFGRIEYAERGLMDYTHVRWYTQQSLQDLFDRFGFEVLNKGATGNLPMGPLRRILPRKFVAWFDNMLVGLLPGLFAWEFNFVFKLRRIAHNDN